MYESRSAKCKGHKKQKIMINLSNSNALELFSFLNKYTFKMANDIGIYDASVNVVVKLCIGRLCQKAM